MALVRKLKEMTMSLADIAKLRYEQNLALQSSMQAYDAYVDELTRKEIRELSEKHERGIVTIRVDAIHITYVSKAIDISKL